MITVLRSGGFSVRIYTDDHEPAHVHVVGDGMAKINLGDANGPELVWAKGMKDNEIRKAFVLVVETRDALLEKWRSIHGA